MNERGETDPSGVAPAPHLLSYDGTFGAIARIALINAFLSVVTLGFYRFWGKTRLRRYIWSRVSFAGERFEYTGRAMELLRGFMVAFVVLLILAGAASIAELSVNVETETGAIVQMLAGIVQGFVFLFLIQFAVYRARRYRLSRTQWRGIRGGQTGSALAYGLRASGWILLTVLSLGLLYPIMRTSLQRTKIQNTWLGGERFTFDGRARAIFGPWIIALLLFLPSLGLSYLWYRVREFQYWTGSTGFSGLRFKSELRTGKVIGIVLIYLGAFILVPVLAWMFFGPALTAALGGMSAVDDDTARAGLQFVPLFILLFVYLVGLPVLNVTLLVAPLCRAIVESLHVIGTLDLDALMQSEIPVPLRGEGFADALDVGSL